MSVPGDGVMRIDACPQFRMILYCIYDLCLRQLGSYHVNSTYINNYTSILNTFDFMDKLKMTKNRVLQKYY